MSQFKTLQCCLLMLGFFIQPAHGQTISNEFNVANPKTADDTLFDLILKVRNSNYDPLVGLTAIPTLKQAFTQTLDPVTKENIANVLIRFGQKDEVYWSTLSKRAQEIVDCDAPNPLVVDDAGKFTGTVSPDFASWATAHNVSVNDALSDHLGKMPTELLLMADTQDPRGLSILRKGLLSPNYAVRDMAARGLALLQDKDSVRSIIIAARTAPKEARSVIATALVFFDDSSAQAAADELITNKELLADLRQRAKQRGPRGLQ